MKNYYHNAIEKIKRIIMLIILTLIFSNITIAHAVSPCNLNSFLNADTSLKKQIDSLLKIKPKHIKIVKLKSKDSTIYYYYKKKTIEIVAIAFQIRSSCCSFLKRYDFYEGALVKAPYLPRKLYKQKTWEGGVYYFSNDKLIYSEEYNIPNQTPDIFISDAQKLKALVIR